MSCFVLLFVFLFSIVDVGQARAATQLHVDSSSPGSSASGTGDDPSTLKPNHIHAASDNSKQSGSAPSAAFLYLTSSEFFLAILVLVFGSFVVMSASINLKGTTVTPEQALRFYGVIVILVGTILLIVVGINSTQIAPAIGLFGTLAGYLLGKAQTGDNDSATKSSGTGAVSDSVKNQAKP